MREAEDKVRALGKALQWTSEGWDDDDIDMTTYRDGRFLFDERCDGSDGFNLNQIDLFLRAHSLSRSPTIDLRFKLLNLFY